RRAQAALAPEEQAHFAALDLLRRPVLAAAHLDRLRGHAGREDQAAGGGPGRQQRAPLLVHYLAIFTSVTVLARLFASTKSPPFVTSVLRTMLPPPGMAQLWNFSVFGSKRTTVFGSVSDSLYQITLSLAEMPYGADF